MNNNQIYINKYKTMLNNLVMVEKLEPISLQVQNFICLILVNSLVRIEDLEPSMLSLNSEIKNNYNTVIKNISLNDQLIEIVEEIYNFELKGLICFEHVSNKIPIILYLLEHNLTSEQKLTYIKTQLKEQNKQNLKVTEIKQVTEIKNTFVTKNNSEELKNNKRLNIIQLIVTILLICALFGFGLYIFSFIQISNEILNVKKHPNLITDYSEFVKLMQTLPPNILETSSKIVNTVLVQSSIGVLILYFNIFWKIKSKMLLWIGIVSIGAMFTSIIGSIAVIVLTIIYLINSIKKQKSKKL